MVLRLLIGLAIAFRASAFEIARIEIRTIDPLSFVFIHTKDGITGMGQMGRSQMDSRGLLADADLVNDMFLRQIAPMAYKRHFVGPADLAKLNDDLFYANYKNTGQMFSRALSGLDTAMWEVFAKRANQSVCQFVGNHIGRPCRASVDFYCTNITRTETPEELMDLITQLHTKYGAKGYKLKIANTMGRNTDPYPNRTVEVIPAVRRAVDKTLGPHVRLMVDSNGGYEDMQHARLIANLLKEHNYYWFEEPVPYWDYQLTKQIKDLGLVRIAAGENEYRMEVLERALVEGTLSVVQPDFGYAGGFSQLLKIALMARHLGVEFDPHSPDLSLTEFFSLHLMGAVSDDGALYEFGCTDESTPTDVFVRNLPVSNGSSTVPTLPGWGVEIRPSWLDRAHVLVYPPEKESVLASKNSIDGHTTGKIIV